MILIGDRIKELRKNCRLTQNELGIKLGLTKSVICAYENGYRLPSIDTLIRISIIFNVSTDYLLGMNSNNFLDLSGLSETDIYAVYSLIKILKQKSK